MRNFFYTKTCSYWWGLPDLKQKFSPVALSQHTHDTLLWRPSAKLRPVTTTLTKDSSTKSVIVSAQLWLVVARNSITLKSTPSRLRVWCIVIYTVYSHTTICNVYKVHKMLIVYVLQHRNTHLQWLHTERQSNSVQQPRAKPASIPSISNIWIVHSFSKPLSTSTLHMPKPLQTSSFSYLILFDP